jgi:plasmid stabilization system protein ParE
MKSVRFHSEARVELEASTLYYDELQSGLGTSLFDEIFGATEKLAAFPYLGAAYKETPFRRLVLTSFPYVLYYREGIQYLWVIAVAHAK